MATRTISTKLAIEGEAQYKQAVASCNAELSTLKSSLALVESEFRGNANSMEALTAKGSALDSMYRKQQEKVSTLEAALRNAQRAYEEYSSRISTAQSNIERCEQALEKLKNSTGDTSKEQEELTKELDKWNAELSEAQAGQAAAERGIQSWQKQLNNAKIDLNGMSDAIEQNDRYLREAEQSADGCAQSIDKYGKEVKDAGESSEEFAQGAQQSKEGIEALASALAAAGVAKAVKEIADALRDCVDTFASFESQMSTVQAISGASGYELAALAEKAKYMGATTAFTATQAAEAFEYMAMAGWKADDMLGGLEGIMHLAAASGESLASTSDIVTDALTAFGLAASDSGHFADVLAAASSNANTNVGMMGETFKYAAPVAGALGYSIEDTALAIGLMANAGIKGSQAGTALRGALTNLTKPSKENAAYMEKLGISLTDSAGNVRSLSDLMGLLRERFSELTAAEQAEYAAGIAGKEAMSGLLAIVNASEADYQKLARAIDTCNGSAKEMSEIKLDNYAGQMTLLNSAIDGFKLAVGESLTPALTKMAQLGTDAFSWATDFVEENPWLVQAIAGAVGALALLTTGFAAYTAIAAAAAAAQTALNGAIGLCPLLGIVAAAGAVVGILGSLVASMDDADKATQSFTESLRESKAAYEDLTSTMAEQQASTRAVAASLQELLAVEEKSALQKDLIQQKVEQLNEAVPTLGLAYDRERDSLVGLTEAELDSALARMAAQEEYEAQVARLSELSNEQAEIDARLTEARLALNEAQETGIGNTWQLQNNINELTIAQSTNAAQIAELEEASRAYGEQQAEAERKTQAMTSTVEGLIAGMTELEDEYEKSYAAAMESINGQMGLFQEMDGSAKTSIDNLIDSLKSQVSYMETYSANIQKAMELGVDEGLVKKLSDGSEESAQILDAIVKGGEDDIQALNDQFRKVEEGKEDFSTTVAEMETDFSNKMDELVRDLDQAIQDMDVQNDAYRIGQNNITGLINGTASQRQALVNQYAQMGRDALAAYKREVGQASPSKKFREVGRFDIQGIVGGVEEEKRTLAAAYEDAARTALDSMERHLPSTLEVPDNAAAVNRQTGAILSAVSGRDSGDPIRIYVDRLEVRNDSDLPRIARELYCLTEREKRSRGGGVL